MSQSGKQLPEIIDQFPKTPQADNSQIWEKVMIPIITPGEGISVLAFGRRESGRE